MEKVEFPMSALEIMQACLIYFMDNAEKSENAEKAKTYLKKIIDIINGETSYLSNEDGSKNLQKKSIYIVAVVKQNT